MTKPFPVAEPKEREAREHVAALLPAIEDARLSEKKEANTQDRLAQSVPQSLISQSAGFSSHLKIP